ncbi:X-ray repair cross-complementing protein 5 [Toxorhynchites rutilus septentrionalis]|uniref:X-ray repair cross-complementing protein 5 n=1 Tax=Toxorhynchites rutilus septentrionalis TaxID=329112 RepID=UPI00247A3606|nr:X-ray repair cross-complementing protein 5 [Toxorhynchites rutilus septentrionalis]
MARTKEACMIILDVGKHTLVSKAKNNQTFFERAKNCVSKIVQRKIFSKPQDEVGLILMGTEETSNQLNVEFGGYDHISEAFELGPSNWQMLRILEKRIKPSSSSAEWINALEVAIHFLNTCARAKKFAYLKIILISTLANSASVDTEQVESVIEKLTKMPCELNIINDSIEHGLDLETQDEDHSTFGTVGIFGQQSSKSKEQRANEKLVSDIVLKSNGALCNIDSAELLLVHFEKKATRAAPWNSMLTIGTQIEISISAYLLISEEKGLGPFKTECVDPNATVQMKTTYYKNDTPFEPDLDNLIKGYMYGSTVVPYDSAMDIDYKSGEQRLACHGFTMTGNILEEYLCGNGTYVVVARKDCSASEAKLSALIKAMIDLDVVMIATKVYRRDTRPRINVLMPTYRKGYPCLIMLELCFQEELALLKFPPLLTNKNKPTDSQYEAIDKLIDSMDLMDALDGDTGSKEAFALHKTLNPIHQHVYRTVAHRALYPKAPLPAMDEELKELVDVPTKLKERSKLHMEQVKQLFSLKEVKVNSRIQWLRKSAQIGLQTDATSAGSSQQNELDAADELDDHRIIVEVGTVTPAEDFALLLKRGEKFATVCTQLQRVISDLVFKSMTIQYEKIAMSIMMYREEAKLLGPYRYNEWIVEFKKSLFGRNKHEFWEQIIVKERFGLIEANESDMSTVTADEGREFYSISSANKTVSEDNVDYIDADDLFANM